MKNKKYVVITWPESQNVMEHKRFGECILINDEKGLEAFGSSAYFVPSDLAEEVYATILCDHSSE